jgi:hypothetical protein
MKKRSAKLRAFVGKNHTLAGPRRSERGRPRLPAPRG